MKLRSSLVSLMAVAAMGTVSVSVAEDDVLSRIKPVGVVNVAGSAEAASAAPAAATPAPAADAATPAAAPAPAATPAAAGDPGAALYQGKGCGGCHGADGKTTPMGTYPKIAGLSVEYLTAQMMDIKSGVRANGQTAMMKPIIAGVSDDEIKAIAEWLAKQ